MDGVRAIPGHDPERVSPGTMLHCTHATVAVHMDCNFSLFFQIRLVPPKYP